MRRVFLGLGTEKKHSAASGYKKQRKKYYTSNEEERKIFCHTFDCTAKIRENPEKGKNTENPRTSSRVLKIPVRNAQGIEAEQKT
jgi:hypothetical protein